MKNFFLSIAAAAAVIMLGACNNSGIPKGFTEEPDDPSRDTVLTFDYGKMAALGHPRLFMTADDFKDLKARIKKHPDQNKLLVEGNRIVLAQAERYVALDESIEYKLDASGKRLLSQSRKALQRIFPMSYAYKMTGDRRYFDAVVKNLREICALKDWHPSHYLDTGEMALAAAIAYDWLYYDLPLDLREAAHKAMVEFGLKTSIGKSYHRAMGNWNQVCNCGTVAAALAVYEKDKAISTEIIETAVKTNMTAQTAIYAPDGNYAEGYGYWSYGTGFETMLLKLLDTAFGSTAGLADTEGFMKTGEYMLFMATPTGGNFSYADGGSSFIRADEDNSRPKIAGGMPAMWWFAAQTGDESLLVNEIRYLKAGLYDKSNSRTLTTIPIFIRETGFSGETGKVPAKSFWSGTGKVPVAMVHTGWKFDDTDKYVGIKGGAPNGGHGHMDAGSFVYESNGIRWSDDLTRPDYAKMENATWAAGGDFWDNSQKGLRWDIFRMNNFGHSTLSFMNNDKSVKDKIHVSDQIVSGKAMIEETYDSADGYGAKLDLTAPYADAVASAHRTVKLVGDQLFVIDEITAKPRMAAQMQWRMLTPAAVEVKADGEVLTKQGKTLNLSTGSSDKNVKVKYTSWEPVRPSDWPKRDWDPENPGYTVAGFTATVPAGKTVTFTTVLK